MSDSRPRLRRFIILTALVLIAAYGLFESRRYLEGPVLRIESPKPGEVVHGPVVRVVGFARNLSYLYINGARGYVDEYGTLLWAYTPPKGYTVLMVRAEDRFGRSREISVPFIVK